MHVLVIGGSRFVGYQLVWRLLVAGHHVTVLNRGTRPDPFHGRVEYLRADRTGSDFPRVLSGRTFDAAVDFAAYTGEDARRAVDVLGSSVGHYIFISTGQVYLVRQDATRPGQVPAREEDYDGPVLSVSPTPRDEEERLYGIGKRDAEDVLRLAYAERGFPATRLRIPVVNGERDHFRRIEGYLWRLLDGGPLILPDGGRQIVRHVYGSAVAQAIAGILGDTRTCGEAYNLAQDEIPTLREVVEELAELMGTSAQVVAVPFSDIEAAGLDPVAVSPFSDPWTSFLDPTKAKEQLGFQHVPLNEYLGRIVACFVNHPPDAPPDTYRDRAAELSLVR